MMRPDAPGSDAVAGHARPRGPDAAARVGRIRFVNCFPLYHHFAEQLSARGVSADIVDGYPSDLNDMLARGAIDVTLSSSIAFARNADAQVLLPQVSISSFGAVDSIQLFARTPPARIRRVAVTEKSATSICLLKVLCREWGIEPEFAPRRGPLSEILEEFDALLLIGDEALHLLRVEAYPYHYDLGAEWKDLTGLPMVYAVCAARQDFVAARPEAAAAVGVAVAFLTLNYFVAIVAQWWPDLKFLRKATLFYLIYYSDLWQGWPVRNMAILAAIALAAAGLGALVWRRRDLFV